MASREENQREFNKAQHLLEEAQERLSLLRESVPITTQATEFSTSAYVGMGWMLGDVLKALDNASSIFKTLGREI